MRAKHNPTDDAARLPIDEVFSGPVESFQRPVSVTHAGGCRLELVPVSGAELGTK